MLFHVYYISACSFEFENCVSWYESKGWTQVVWELCFLFHLFSGCSLRSRSESWQGYDPRNLVHVQLRNTAPGNQDFPPTHLLSVLAGWGRVNPSGGSVIGWSLDQNCDIYYTHLHLHNGSHSRRDTPLGAYVVNRFIYYYFNYELLSLLTSSVDAVSDSNCFLLICWYFLVLVSSCHCSLLETCLHERIVIIVTQRQYSNTLVLIHSFAGPQKIILSILTVSSYLFRQGLFHWVFSFSFPLNVKWNMDE